MNVAGGSDVVRFFVSGNVENALGRSRCRSSRGDASTVARGHPRRWQNRGAAARNFRANINASITPTIELGVTTGFMKSDQRLPQSTEVRRHLPNGARVRLRPPRSQIQQHRHARKDPAWSIAWVPSESSGPQHAKLASQTMAGPRWHPLCGWQRRTGGVDYNTDFNVCRLNGVRRLATSVADRLQPHDERARTVSAKISSISTWNARPASTSRPSVRTTPTSGATTARPGWLPPGAQNVSQAASRTDATISRPRSGRSACLFKGRHHARSSFSRYAVGPEQRVRRRAPLGELPEGQPLVVAIG